MTYLAIVLVAIGSLVVGAALAARALSAEHAHVERKRLQLDLERKQAATAREKYELLAAELRGPLHLEGPSDRHVVLDLGAHRRGRGLAS